jgi:hypothetical protein
VQYLFIFFKTTRRWSVEVMDKVDFRKELKNLYNPSSKEVALVEVPAMNFLMLDGEGDPGTCLEYKATVEALFNVSYALKFMVKKTKSVDYAVMPLEGLWWVDDMTKFSVERKDEWKWTSMVMQPKYVTAEAVKLAVEQVGKKKNLAPLAKLRFESFHEGTAAQIMHVGPYSTEGPDVEKIHAFIQNSGHALIGKHHEIYLNDPTKAAPEKLKTILRQPMK